MTCTERLRVCEEKMHVSHMCSFSLFSIVFLWIISFPLKRIKIRLNFAWIKFSLNRFTRWNTWIHVPRSCVICCTQGTIACLHALIGELPVAIGLNWKQTTYIFFVVIIILDLSFSGTPINLIAHLIVHLCFHQFHIDFLDCFFHLINVCFFICSKAFVFHSIYPIVKI